MSILTGIQVLAEVKSKYNGKISVVRSVAFGTYIQVNNLTQSGGMVREIWGETLKKIYNLKFTINNCLILGLGGGSAALAVRKYWPQAKITGVDIDKTMIELGKKYLGLKDIDIVIADAADFLKLKTSTLKPVIYNLIIVDTYVGDEFPEKFESEKFLRLISRLLTVNGVAVFNRLYYEGKRSAAVKFGNKLEKVFAKVDYFYPAANLMFFCRR